MATGPSLAVRPVVADTDGPGPGGIRDPQTYAVIGAGMRVHRELGSGFPEAVYREALAIELSATGVPFIQEPHVAVWYGGHRLSASYRPDFVCFDELLVELKAQAQLGPPEHGQVVSYLKATRLTRALLINFGRERLDYRRFVHAR